jgi:hypothetical protein
VGRHDGGSLSRDRVAGGCGGDLSSRRPARRRDGGGLGAREGHRSGVRALRGGRRLPGHRPRGCRGDRKQDLRYGPGEHHRPGRRAGLGERALLGRGGPLVGGAVGRRGQRPRHQPPQARARARAGGVLRGTRRKRPGLFHCARAYGGLMVPNGRGKIINMASRSGSRRCCPGRRAARRWVDV